MNQEEALNRIESIIRRAKADAWEEGWVAGTELEFNIYTSTPYTDN